ncbi:MAG TPA: AraC family transcriptional regulator, partial [Bacillota bacterium]|nr:AraC family transcriptional regulator [Bacillota bacterium]
MAQSIDTDGKISEFVKNHVFYPENHGSYKLHQLTEVFCESNYKFACHLQWCYEITYVISGTGETHNDSNAYPIKAGDVFVTPLGTTHQIISHDRLRYLCVGFEIDCTGASDEIHTLNGFFSKPPEYPLNETERIKNLIQYALDDQYTLADMNDFTLTMQLNLLCAYVYRLFMQKPRNRYLVNNSDRLYTFHLPLYSVLLYIDANVSQIKNITVLADKLGYNPSYLSHVFKENTGVTLQQYICEKRVELAIRFGSERRMSVDELSKQCGFST